jgi:hypothetical protein
MAEQICARQGDILAANALDPAEAKASSATSAFRPAAPRRETSRREADGPTWWALADRSAP